MTTRGYLRGVMCTLVIAWLGGPLWSEASERAQATTSDAPLELMTIDMDPSLSPLRSIIDRFATDYRLLRRRSRVPMSPTSRELVRDFLKQWQTRLARVDFSQLNQDDRVDYILLRNELVHELDQLDFRGQRDAELSGLLPFAPAIVRLLEAQQAMQPVASRETAEQLSLLARDVEAATKQGSTAAETVSKPLVNRALQRLAALRGDLRDWFEMYAGYDPDFTWWVTTPYRTVEAALEKYEKQLREAVVGNDADAIVGDPIGNDALQRELTYEMICYTPDELIDIADREFAWCEAELLKAAHELGYGDDWRRALEHVKDQHVAPGEQPELIRQQALAAIRFLDEHDLVTIPALCRTSWRIAMMSPERQRVNPYFTGGEVISVSFPTESMTHEEKLMSLRSNNIHFCWATVQHELIPGHHLQGFMSERYRQHRQQFRTPFLVEGWALYWEMLLWDLDFPRTAEDRIGMLFWRMHRCARISLSLRFHLNQQSPSQMVEFLVSRVGHERSAAEAEVSPLGQRRLRPAISSGIHAGRPATKILAPPIGRLRTDVQSRIPRRGVTRKRDSH